MIEKWPYTNLYNLNLDWILETVKDVAGKMDTLPEELKTEILEELTEEGIYSEQNPPPYPTNAQYIKLPDITTDMAQNWNIYRPVNGVNYGIQFSAASGDPSASLMVGNVRYPILFGNIINYLDPGDDPREWDQTELAEAYNNSTRIFFGSQSAEDEDYNILYGLLKQSDETIIVNPLIGGGNVTTVNGLSGAVELPTVGNATVQNRRMVPAPTDTAASSNKYLRSDGSWSTPPGSGTGAVDSVNGAVGEIIIPVLGDSAAGSEIDPDGYLVPDAAEAPEGSYLKHDGSWAIPAGGGSASLVYKTADSSLTGFSGTKIQEVCSISDIGPGLWILISFVRAQSTVAEALKSSIKLGGTSSTEDLALGSAYGASNNYRASNCSCIFNNASEGLTITLTTQAGGSSSSYTNVTGNLSAIRIGDYYGG